MQQSNYLDLTELAKDLFKAADNVEQATQELLEAAGDAIVADAKSRVVVKTGALKNSITRTSMPLKVIVGPQALHGTFIEYGTGTKGEFPGSMYEILPKNGSVLVFKVGNRTVYARSVKHPGIKAQPFMRPAAKDWVEDLPRDMARVGVMLLTGHNPRAVAN
jgi:HK97 gp10 family phage protein